MRLPFLQLTSIKNLLGRPNQRFLLFGMLGRTAEGDLCLEDGDGIVTLDMEETVSPSFSLLDSRYHLMGKEVDRPFKLD